VVNSVVLVGRLGRDPEMKVTSGGASMCKFSIAVDRPYRGPDGEKVTDWLDIIAWRERAEFCGTYLQKGTLVAIQGRVHVRKWESPEGEPRRAYEIQAENVQILSGGTRSGGGDATPPSDEDAPPSGRASGPGPSSNAAKKITDGDSYDDAFEPNDDPYGGE